MGVVKKMDPQWFYQDDGRKGPVDTTELVRALLELGNPRNVKVWREGLPDWIDAGLVADIAKTLPPPVVSAPSAHTAPRPSPPIRAVEAVAQNYRTLVLLVGLQILLVVISRVLTNPLLGLTLLLASFAVAVAMALFAYRLMAGLEAGTPTLWAVGIFVPLVNLVVLAAISSRAQAWCKRSGITVGFLGPTASSLAEFRARIQS